MKNVIRHGVFTCVVLVLILLLAQRADAADEIKFFKNYFVTGGHAVAGVGMRGTGVGGWATGAINMGAVPCTLGSAYVSCNTTGAVPADIVAAFLYWETVETTSTPLSRVGYFDGEKILGKIVGTSSACWSSGGTNPQVFARTYRADVLRRLTVDRVNNVRQANGTHTVKLVDSGGNGNGSAPYTNGATLLVIYRVLVPGNPTFAPMRAVVIQDGAFTIPARSSGLTLQSNGFFQADVNSTAKVTQIVGNGQSDFRANLQFNGAPLNTESIYLGSAGSSWDNPSFQINLAENTSAYATSLIPTTNQTCLNFVAQVTDLKVKDGDADGLLDIWEDTGFHQNESVSPATFGGCNNFPSDCVNLPAMGASKTKKDIFLELDWMHGTDGHLHVPKLAALSNVACAFGAKGIAVHFDVGALYPNEKCPGSANSFIVPASLARGGEVIEESSLRCPIATTQNNQCAYSVPYSVLSYKTGFRLLRDGFQLLKNGVPVLDIPRRFARNRKDIFHYGLFAHALSGPFDPNTGQALTPDPSSVSGVGDRPGGDFMVTLGRWRYDDPIGCLPGVCNDQTGSADVQAGTLAHELGHNLFLSHAGNSRAPYCMPNYPSVMNYAYQTRLLTDAQGGAHVDFSDGALNPLNEGALPGGSGALGNLKYRVRFFGPPINPHEGIAKAYCGGAAIIGGSAVRLEGLTVGTPDWNRDGIANTIGFDANYDGALGGPLLKDSNDWASMNLQQISARLNSNGLSTDVGALDFGALDFGALDFGALDFGALDISVLDLGALDFGALDFGALDFGALDFGALDFGALDFGALDFGEQTYSEVSASPDATSAAQPLTASDSAAAITLAWGAPPTARVRRYDIYRADDGVNFVLLNYIAGTPPSTGYIDQVNDFVNSGSACPNVPGKTCYNKTYTYYVTTWVLSEADGLVESPASNMVASKVKHAFVLGNNQGSVVYGNAYPTAPSFTIFGELYGTLAGVTCGYSPANPRNVGSYTVTCTGPSNTSQVLGGVTRISGISYNQPYNDGVLHTAGTLTITKRPITVTADALSKIRRDPDPVLTYRVTTGSMVTGDSFTGVLTRVAGEDLGTYPILQGTLTAGANYDLTYVGALFTIVKRP